MRPRRLPVLLVASALGGALLAAPGLAPAGAATPARTTPAAAPTAAASAAASTATPACSASYRAPRTVKAGRVTKVLTVVLENRGRAAALQGMPKLAAVGKTYGLTSCYRAVTHPSLPNYLGLTAGQAFGIRDDKGPSAHPIDTPSVFDAAIQNGRTAKAYIEAMPTACRLTSVGRYDVSHNPWAYFSSLPSRFNCASLDVPAGTTAAGELRDDIRAGALPHVGMLVPDTCNSGQKCSSAVTDRWLAAWFATIRSGQDWRSGRLAVVVTFDETPLKSSNEVLTVVATPGLRAVTSRTPLSHVSWTRWMNGLTGAAPLGQAGRVSSLGSAFGL